MRGLACNFCLFFKICCNINTYVANHQEKNKNLDLCEGNMNLKNPYTREIVPPKNIKFKTNTFGKHTKDPMSGPIYILPKRRPESVVSSDEFTPPSESIFYYKPWKSESNMKFHKIGKKVQFIIRHTLFSILKVIPN